MYVVTELKRLGDTLCSTKPHSDWREYTLKPSRPREGDVRYADGTDWDPGSGEGIYFFKKGSPGSWVLLG